MVSECEIPPAQLLTEKPDKALARPGVYAILCDANGKYYVGSSANVGKRIRQHFNSLLSGRHHNPRMQHAFSRHGGSRFIFQVLEFAERDEDKLVECERKWIRDIDSAESGFNVMPAANCPIGVVRVNRENFRNAAIARSSNPNSKGNRKYRFISPSGELFEGFNIARFCRDHGFSASMRNNLLNLARGGTGAYKGWTSPDSLISGSRRGSPSDFSFTDPSGAVHAGNNISSFCRSLGLHKGFFASLISGMKNQAGWTITPGFVFKRRNRNIKES